MDFEIPKRQQEYLLDWSYSNLLSNWKIGYRTGLEFIEYRDLEYRDLDKPFPRKPDVEEPPKPKQSEQERL